MTVGINTLTRGRSGVVQFVCGTGETAVSKTLTIYQEATEPYAWLTDWQAVTVPAEGGTISTRLSYNTSWRLSCDDDRILISPATDMDSGLFYETGIIPVTITVPENPTATQKTYYITLCRYLNAQEYNKVYYQFFQAGNN